MDEHYLNTFTINRRYKATMLSIKMQIEKLFQSIVAFLIGFVMTISYSLGYLVAGLCALVILLVLYPFVRRVHRC